MFKFKPKLGHGNLSPRGLAPQTGARNLAGMKWERGRMKPTSQGIPHAAGPSQATHWRYLAKAIQRDAP